MGLNFITQVLVQMLMCVVVGGTIGIIAKEKTKVTGARTFILVTVGSALVTIVSVNFAKQLSNPWLADPGRIAAQIVSAFGFISTGVIWLADDPNRRGLWTAAALWVSAILGMSIGSGWLGTSTIGLVFTVVALLGIEHYLSRRNR
ncbi:MAG: MgtC/SapB family protein [Syntrophomonadaceae bacterium]|nr:MgtC/SapB family protein [Syntrophomonadaceae bacterium]